MEQAIARIAPGWLVSVGEHYVAAQIAAFESEGFAMKVKSDRGAERCALVKVVISGQEVHFDPTIGRVFQGRESSMETGGNDPVPPNPYVEYISQQEEAVTGATAANDLAEDSALLVFPGGLLPAKVDVADE